MHSRSKVIGIEDDDLLVDLGVISGVAFDTGLVKENLVWSCECTRRSVNSNSVSL